MANFLGSLFVKIAGDNSDLDKKIGQSEKGLKNFGDRATKVGGTLTKRLTLPLIGAATAATGLAINAGKTADKILDLEQVTGLSTDAIQEFKNVAIVAGVNFDTLVGSLQRFSSRLDDIQREGSPANEAVKQLGINVTDATGAVRSADDLFPEFLGKLNEVENITERNALAQELFGRSLNDLAPVLALSSEELQNARDQARSLGLVQSREALVSANDFRVSVEQLTARLQQQGVELGTKLIPIIEKLFPVFERIIDAVSDVVDFFGDLDEGTQNLIIAFGGIATIAGPATSAIGGISRAIGFLTGPAGPVVAAVALVAGLVAVIDNLSKSLDPLTEEESKEIFDFIDQRAIDSLKNQTSNVLFYGSSLEDLAVNLGRTREETEALIVANAEQFDAAFIQQLGLTEAVEEYNRLRATAASNARFALQEEQLAAEKAEAAAEAARQALAQFVAGTTDFLDVSRAANQAFLDGILTEGEALQIRKQALEDGIEAAKQSLINGEATTEEARNSIEEYEKWLAVVNELIAGLGDQTEVLDEQSVVVEDLKKQRQEAYDQQRQEIKDLRQAQKEANDEAKKEEAERQKDRVKLIAEANQSILGSLLLLAEETLGIEEQTAEERKRLQNSIVEAFSFAQSQISNISKLAFESEISQVEQEIEARTNAGQLRSELEALQLENTIARENQRIEEINQLLAEETDAVKRENLERERDTIEKTQEVRDAEEQAEREKAHEIGKIKRKQAEIDKAVSIANTLSSGAEAAIKAWATLGPIGGPIAAGIIGGLTTANVGLIESQPLPEVPALSQGGFFSGPALIGEAGREFAFPIDGPQGQTAMALMADQIVQAMGRGGSSNSTTVQFSSIFDISDEATRRRAAREIMPFLIDEASRRGGDLITPRSV